jgi:GT2 family glycosyltransferase
MKIAVLLTVFNRIEKTLLCLDSLLAARMPEGMAFEIFITNDGSTDNTTERIKEQYPNTSIILLNSENLYWNGGMNNSWKAAIDKGGFDGYLWLNNDTIVLPNLWEEIVDADSYSKTKYGIGGIYVGSTCDKDYKTLTYGGFDYINKWTLKDKFVVPNGEFQNCQCAHGNITYISQDIVARRGILYSRYKHSGGDHDYTYMAYKHKLPLFIFRAFVGICKNDHLGKDEGDIAWENEPLKERLKRIQSPIGYNLKNTLIFQRRCFPFRYPLVWVAGYFRIFFPKAYKMIYSYLRK